jgi:hypothetical protein
VNWLSTSTPRSSSLAATILPPDVVDQAVVATTKLAPVTACADVEELRRRSAARALPTSFEF